MLAFIFVLPKPSEIAHVVHKHEKQASKQYTEITTSTSSVLGLINQSQAGGEDLCQITESATSESGTLVNKPESSGRRGFVSLTLRLRLELDSAGILHFVTVEITESATSVSGTLVNKPESSGRRGFVSLTLSLRLELDSAGI
ncbi:hypothetical protein J6590_052092 [Homalodisca vitripennis]|nr:hypothetical protein J6590_052092 [Homalodisca vitripennis]